MRHYIQGQINTLKVNLNTTHELVKDIPDNKIIVNESGINTRDNVKVIESTKVDAILVGTSLMKARDIGARIDELLGK
jgi:indole-3-glycerol phosphate synthase